MSEQASRAHRKALVLVVLLALAQFASLPAAAVDADIDPRELVRKAMDHWRGVSSYSEMTMIVHRADWQRRFSMRAWTRGSDRSLVRVTAPARDAGNGTLVKDRDMWTYSPKINRVLKLPSSMMNQGWLGSDFSNRDISKSTDIVDQYEHRLLDSEAHDGHRLYRIESIPHEDAAVVWGKEIAEIRDDFLLLRHEFWDQDGILVKTMTATEIKIMDNRPVASRLRMQKADTPDEWTTMVVDTVDFDITLPAGLFTLSNLRNPRQ